MKKAYLSLVVVIFICVACDSKKSVDSPAVLKQDTLSIVPPAVIIDTSKQKSFYVPSGFTIFEEIKGDLNKDAVEDLVLIIKGTEKDKIVKDEYRGLLDRNRRGIIVLLKKGNGYVEATKNYNCFSSENEDGGVYYAPELDLVIEKGNLYISYRHGRYGYWSYTFRLNDKNMELIGYDASSNRGPIILNEVSINFLTRQRIDKVNQNEHVESGDEVFKESRTRIDIKKSLKLSEIKDFDDLNF